MANQILLEIQRGVRLKKAVCNDRSRPNLNGLGVFRRQLSTVDQPSDPAEPTTPLIEPVEDFDDIDKVRDDLQSTKQLLEIELKNRVKIEEANAKMQAEIRRLKEELAKKPTTVVTATTNSVPPPSSVSSNHHGLSADLRKSTSRMQMLARQKAAKKEDAESDDDSEEVNMSHSSVLRPG